MFSIPDRYWAAHLNCQPDELFSQPLNIVTHGDQLRGYGGALGMFREGSATVSVPPDRAEELRGLLAGLERGCTPNQFVVALAPVALRAIGPAYIGYATGIAGDDALARTLNDEDADAVESLEDACDEEEWDHGGSSLDDPCSGVFCDGRLAALAGYATWGGNIGHVCIVTHPAFRGRGFGKHAVAHIARRILANGLLPQYRTLNSNAPAIRIAEALGFQRYATSMAVRLVSTDL